VKKIREFFMKVSLIKIIGIILLVVGVVVLILGAYNLISFNSSTGGKIANKVAGVFGAKTETVKNSIIQISIGIACLVVGVVLYKKR
jgi:multidrug transporter EmrE-like cation transporter